MADEWMYRDFGQDFGPVPYTQLQSLAAAGTISPDCEVRCTHESSWKKAGDVAGLEFPNSARDTVTAGSDSNISVKGADDWYYNVGGLELGPVTFDELLELGRTEQLTADDQVRLGANSKWRRAGSIGRLMAVLPFQVADQTRKVEQPSSNASSNAAGFQAVVPKAPAPASVEIDDATQAKYVQAYEQAKENIANLIVAQAEAAFKTAEAQANKEISWAFAPGIDSQWWGWMGSVEFGPVGFQQVLALARQGQVKPSDFVRNGLLGQYVPAGNLPGLFSAAAAINKATEALNLAKAQAKAAVELSHPPLPPQTVATATIQKKATPAREFPVVSNATKSDPSLKTINTTTSAKPSSRTPENESTQRDGSRPSVAAARSNPAIPVESKSAQPVDVSVNIIDLVRESFASRNIPSLNRIELEFSGGELVLRGNLPSEGERLLALRLAGQISGVTKVVDSLTVTQPSRATPARSSPVIAAVARPAPRSGSNAFSGLIDSVRTLNPKYGVSAVAVVGLLGFGIWSFAGNSRPVAVHPVKGRVILNGEPIANASIVLHRVGHSNVPVNLHPRARAKDDGSFALETFDPGDGAPNGEFVATVSLNKTIEADGEVLPGPNVLPAVYSRPDTSPLKIKITQSTRELQPLELTDKQ